MNPNHVGDCSVGQILSHLLKKHLSVLLPFSGSSRYDLVVDRGDGKFERVQVKSGRLIHNQTVVEFNSGTESGKGYKSYSGDADTFGVYCQELDKVYFVPVADSSGTKTRLRLLPCKNKQAKKIRYAKDYEV